MRRKRVSGPIPKSLLKKIATPGHSTGQAIAELVDNAIDARGSACVSICVTLDFAGRSITVDDDGRGMDPESLRSAMATADPARRKAGALGTPWLGMKSACLALGRRISIKTSTDKLPDVYGMECGKPAWPANTAIAWSKPEIKKIPKARPWHGTSVRITDLSVPLYPKQAKTLLGKFGLRYAPHIKSENVRIRINGKECVAATPEIKGAKQDIEINLGNEGKISGWIAELKTRSTAHQGFILYRKNRIMRSSDKFGLHNHPALAKLTGELHLDHVPTDPRGTKFVTDSPEYMEAERAFMGDAAVIRMALQCSKPARDTIKPIVNYIAHGVHDRNIRRRVGLGTAQNIMKDARSFEFTHANSSVRFDFEYGDGRGLYSISSTGPAHRITVDRNSRMFSTVHNPATMLAMIWEEAKIALLQPGMYDKFLQLRNASWARFAAIEADRPRPTNRIKSKYNYLSPVLDGVQDVLSKDYPPRYQLTALCVLEPYLHHAQRNLYYTIVTEKGKGEYMQALLYSQVKDDITFLHMPTREQLEFLPQIAAGSVFVIIREQASVQASVVASHEKAILDLYREKRRGMPIGAQDIKMLVDTLRDDDVISMNRLCSMARHRNLDPNFYMRGEASDD